MVHPPTSTRNGAEDRDAPDFEPLMTIEDVARYWQCSENTVRNRMADGCPYEKIGGLLRFRRSAIDEWTRSNP